jgi:hypothetical protein
LMPKLKNDALLSSLTNDALLSSLTTSSTKLKKKAKSKLAEFESEIPHTVAEAKTKFLHSSTEGIKRGANSAGHVAARAVAEIKSPVNRFITTFIGDVFAYLHERGDYRSPGWIPSRFLECVGEARRNKLERDGEPLIVMSHSMGGQIVYDAVTHFLPRMDEFNDTKIDFWVATASQVGLFEELKLFLESSEDYTLETGEPAPFPDSRYLGYWWNVWDHNDVVSYSVRGIIDGVDDEAYSTGLFVVGAHGGYLEMPSFFRKFARKVESVLGSPK